MQIHYVVLIIVTRGGGAIKANLMNSASYYSKLNLILMELFGN